MSNRSLPFDFALAPDFDTDDVFVVMIDGAMHIATADVVNSFPIATAVVGTDYVLGMVNGSCVRILVSSVVQ